MFYKGKHNLHILQRNSFPGTHQEHWRHTSTRRRFTAALFKTALNWKHPGWPPMEGKPGSKPWCALPEVLSTRQGKEHSADIPNNTGGSQEHYMEQKWTRKGLRCGDGGQNRARPGRWGADRKKAERLQGLHTIHNSPREVIPQQRTFIITAEMIYLDVRISTFSSIKKKGQGPSWELSFLVWSTAGFLLKQTFFATFSLWVPSYSSFQPGRKAWKKGKGDKNSPVAKCSVQLSRGIQVCADGTAYGAPEPKSALPFPPTTNTLTTSQQSTGDALVDSASQMELRCPKAWDHSPKLTSPRVASGA